jgi:hypothetical protein
MAVLLLWLAAAVQAQPLQAWDFEKAEHGWMTVDEQAELKLTNDAGHVYAGEGALQFTFEPRLPAEGENPGIVIVPLQGIIGVQSVHLALQTSVSGPLMLVLTEEDQSGYMYLLHLEAGDWHVLDLPVADFNLSQDDVDENNMLDLDQVTALGVVDPTGWLLKATEQGEMPLFLNQPTQRDLWIDEVQLLPTVVDRLKPGMIGNAPAIMIENADTEAAYWLVIGGRNRRVSTDTEQAASGGALRIDYELPEKSLMIASRNVRRGLLGGMSTLAFCARAGAALNLLVSLEEYDKSRYNAIVEVPEGQWKEFILPLSSFTLGDDSTDEDRGLQPEKVTSVQFLDATPLFTGKESANSLWLDEVRAQ